MGNIGRSSTGCHRCRKRKIKCDEAKPGCRRCAAIRQDCPGYPYSVELELRPSSEAVSGIRKSSIPLKSEALVEVPLVQVKHEAVAPRFECATNCTKTLDNSDGVVTKCECVVPQPILALVPAHDSILPPPKYDVQHQSTSFFLHLFCYQASRLYEAPIFDYLPEMLVKSGTESCIHKATKAVSRMTLADQYSGSDVRLQTGQEYGQALAKTNATIRNTSEAVKDETVVAVWLLGLYEAVSSVLSHGRVIRDPRTPEEEWRSHVLHIRGAMHLLRIRGASQTTNLRAEKIYRIFKAAIQMRLFILNSVTSTDFDNLEDDVYQDEHEFLPSETARRATTYFHAVARLLERLKHALRRADKPELFVIAEDQSLHVGEDRIGARWSKLNDLIHEAEQLDVSMNNWAKAEAGWDMMDVQESTSGTMWALYPSHAIHYFHSFWVYLYWLRYLMARIKLHEGLITVMCRQKDILACAGHAAESLKRFDVRIAQYKSHFQHNAGEVIGLTAYALGDVTNSGLFHSSVNAAANNLGKGFREINVVAAMQLVIPLKVLQRSEHPTLMQKGAINLAIGQIGDGFRRTPVYC